MVRIKSKRNLKKKSQTGAGKRFGAFKRYLTGEPCNEKEKHQCQSPSSWWRTARCNWVEPTDPSWPLDYRHAGYCTSRKQYQRKIDHRAAINKAKSARVDAAQKQKMDTQEYKAQQQRYAAAARVKAQAAVEHDKEERERRKKNKNELAEKQEKHDEKKQDVATKIRRAADLLMANPDWQRRAEVRRRAEEHRTQNQANIKSPAPSKFTEHYDTLGLQPNATDEEIRASYLNLARALHPDKNSGPTAAAKFQAIEEAYEVLSDNLKRSHYDITGMDLKTKYDANKDRDEEELTIQEKKQAAEAAMVVKAEKLAWEKYDKGQAASAAALKEEEYNNNGPSVGGRRKLKTRKKNAQIKRNKKSNRPKKSKRKTKRRKSKRR
jgi:hypothetical protein